MTEQHAYIANIHWPWGPVENITPVQNTMPEETDELARIQSAISSLSKKIEVDSAHFNNRIAAIEDSIKVIQASQPADLQLIAEQAANELLPKPQLNEQSSPAEQGLGIRLAQWANSDSAKILRVCQAALLEALDFAGANAIASLLLASNFPDD